MIEVHLTYNVRPNIDEQAYFEWMKKAIIPALKSRGVLEVSAHRNINRNDFVLVATAWDNLEHWNDYSKSESWKLLIETLENNFADNIRLELWGVSQLIPVPIHPPKST